METQPQQPITAEETITRKLKRFWYKLTGPTKDRALYIHSMYGKFRVLYSDGNKSQPFGYSVAKDYAEMFNGTVIDNF